MARNGTYLRAATAPEERCPTCAEPLLRLRWGHEERCQRYYDADLKRTVRVAMLLLVLSIIAFAVPARAQGVGDASAVADGLAKNPLAWMVVILLAAVVFLGRALLASYEARMLEQRGAHEQTLSTLTSVVTLSLKQTEGLDVLDKALDRLTPNPRED